MDVDFVVGGFRYPLFFDLVLATRTLIIFTFSPNLFDSPPSCYLSGDCCQAHLRLSLLLPTSHRSLTQVCLISH